MIDLDSHAKATANVRSAASLAAGISESLRKLNSGPVFDYEREKLVAETKSMFDQLAKMLGEAT